MSHDCRSTGRENSVISGSRKQISHETSREKMPGDDLLSLQVFYSGILCLHDLVEFSYLTGGLLSLDKPEK